MELRSKQAFRTSLPLILRTRLRLAYGGLLRRCYNPCRMYQKHFKYIFIIYINKTHKVNKIMGNFLKIKQGLSLHVLTTYTPAFILFARAASFGNFHTFFSAEIPFLPKLKKNGSVIKVCPCTCVKTHLDKFYLAFQPFFILHYLYNEKKFVLFWYSFWISFIAFWM